MCQAVDIEPVSAGEFDDFQLAASIVSLRGKSRKGRKNVAHPDRVGVGYVLSSLTGLGMMTTEIFSLFRADCWRAFSNGAGGVLPGAPSPTS